MNLRSQILKEHSKENAQKIANWIGNDQERFASLIQLFLHDEYRVVQRAAWVISMVADEHPYLISSQLDVIVHKLQEPGLPVAVKRNVVRILQTVDIPEHLQGMVMEYCFSFLADPKKAIAVRAFAMTVLINLSKTYPEIKPELKLLIEEGLTQSPSAGYKARARAVLKEL